MEDGEVRQRLVPGLTVLYHPDLERVGEWVALPELVRGGVAELSRLVPDFTPPFPHRPGGARRWPLTDAWLSRRPLLLCAAGGGAVRLRQAGSRTRVEVDGQPLEDARLFSSEVLEQGVVLLLAGRIVLLLHLVDPRGVEPRPVGWPAAGSPSDRVLGLVGESRPMARLRRELASLEPGPVLLRGEVGTGFEPVARALHGLAASVPGPFRILGSEDLATPHFEPPRGLSAREETDLHRLRCAFRAAQGGTLFVDSIEALSMSAQAWLADVLADPPTEPRAFGGTVRAAAPRLVAATAAPLERAVAQGRFRPPLLHRLMGGLVRLPPLRTCREDLGRLLLSLLAAEEDTSAPPEPWIPARLVARLALHNWPGNHDQLRHVVSRLARAYREAGREPTAEGAEHDDRLSAVLDDELGASPGTGAAIRPSLVGG